MTRINCIDVDLLTREHCFAETREMPRIRHAWPRATDPIIPETYRLGKGHVTFFYDKGIWLMRRHRLLLARCINHWEYDIKNIPPLDLSHWPDKAMNDWEPDDNARKINLIRIHKRLNGK